MQLDIKAVERDLTLIELFGTDNAIHRGGFTYTVSAYEAEELALVMTVNYGSAAYFLYLSLPLILGALIYFLIRKRPCTVQRAVLISLSFINLAQHLFKYVIYSHYEGTAFGILATAYNMCALLIILTPLAYLLPSEMLRSFVFLTGTAAGIIALAVPYWRIGEGAFTPEMIRFALCHTLLFITSLLPLALGLHAPRRKRAPLIGLLFFFGVGITVLNDVIFLFVSNTELWGRLFSVVSEMNPVWAFGPPESFSFVTHILRPITPDIFLFGLSGGPLPFLWYFIPVYTAITLFAYLFSLALEKTRGGGRKRVDFSKNYTK